MTTILSLGVTKNGKYYLTFSENEQAFGLLARVFQQAQTDGIIQLEKSNVPTSLPEPPVTTAELRQRKRLQSPELKINLSTPTLENEAVLKEIRLREYDRRWARMTDEQRIHSAQKAEIVEAVTELAKELYGDNLVAEVISSFYTDLYKGLAQEEGIEIPKRRSYCEIGETRPTRLAALLYEGKGAVFLSYLNKRLRREKHLRVVN
jgi:hypothetical protein